MDQDQPRAINSRPLIFAFNFDLGSVGKADVKPVILALGDSRDLAVSYQRKPILPLWRSYWPARPQMMAAFYDDAAVAHWTFDEGTGKVAADSSGGGNDAALGRGAPGRLLEPQI